MNDNVRQRLSICFSTDEHCATCKGLLHIDVPNEDAADRFLVALDQIIKKRQNDARNSAQLNRMRTFFWSMVLMFLCWTALFAFSKQNQDMLAGYSLAMCVIFYGAIYSLCYIINHFMNKYYEKKQLKNEIEILTQCK